MNQKEIKIGDIVKYIGNKHDTGPEYYPPIGTPGVVNYIGTHSIRVKWDEGSTSDDDFWYCGHDDVEVVSSAPENEESKRIELGKNMVGKKVRLVNKEEHYYTVSNGSIGTIIDFDEDDDITPYQVKWESGEIGWVFARDIEEVESNPISEMTNKEIWEMLKPKMEKNGLKPSKIVEVNFEGDCNIGSIFTVPTTYYESDVINAIALAYRSGYLRAIKGRPFKIGSNKTGHSEPKKEKTGHWVPVDPNNLPKEGTKVRYSRQFNNNVYNRFENRTNMKIGETTVVKYGKFGVFGVKPIHGTREWWCSSSYPDRFDMWVEDNE